MTGGDFSLEALLAVVAAVLGAVGSAFGWPTLVKIADWIKKRDEKAKAAVVAAHVPTVEPLADTKELPVVPPKEVL